MVLNKHSQLKKKYPRANDSPFMTKALRKLIINRSRCKHVHETFNCRKLGKISET